MRFEFRQVPIALELVRRAGGTPAEVLARAGLAPEVATQRSVTVDVDVAERLLDECAAQTKTPAFGLELARHVPRGVFGWLEFGLRSAATLDDALPLLVRYYALVNRKAGFSYSQSGATRELTYDVPGRKGGLGPHLNEFSIAYVLGVARQVVGRDWVPERVWFAHAEPAWARDVHAHFGCPVRFGAKASGLAIPAGVATRPFVEHDAPLQALVRARLEELMPLHTSSQPITTRVRAELVARIGRDEVDAAAIARTLGFSTRTLQRTLADEGASFTVLVEDARRSLAETLLARDDLGVEQVAALLGYADLRGFDRAFKRWTGTSPTRWRARAT